MILNRKVKGMSGFFLITVMMVMSLVFVMVLNLSRNSTIIAIADNFAHIVSTKIAITCYNTGIDSFSYLNQKISDIKIEDIYQESYYPLEDFNRMMKEYNINYVSEESKYCDVAWDNNKLIATFRPGPMKTYYGKEVTPHIQESIIENE